MPDPEAKERTLSRNRPPRLFVPILAALFVLNVGSGRAEPPPPSESEAEAAEVEAAEAPVDPGHERARAEHRSNEDIDVVAVPSEEQPEGPGEEEGETEEGGRGEQATEEAALPPPIVVFYLGARAVGRFAYDTDASGGEGSDWAVEDDASRFGVFAAKDVRPGWSLFARTEIGVNLVDRFGSVFNPKATGSGNDGLFVRLGYLGVETPYGKVTFGKQWSAYWPVAAFADIFPYSGGLANGALNSGTDGGASGTGRADDAAVYHLDRGKVEYRLQWRRGGGRIPGSGAGSYGKGYGASLVVEGGSELSFGVAYNRTEIDELTEELREIGIDGDDESFIAGVMYRREPLYLGFTYSKRDNHDLDATGVYSDTTGVELYSRWILHERYRLVGGVNYLEAESAGDGPRPSDDQIDRILILGFEYALRDSTFRSAAFAQLLFGESDRFFDSSRGTVFVAGLRWDFRL